MGLSFGVEDWGGLGVLWWCGGTGVWLAPGYFFGVGMMMVWWMMGGLLGIFVLGCMGGWGVAKPQAVSRCARFLDWGFDFLLINVFCLFVGVVGGDWFGAPGLAVGVFFFEGFLWVGADVVVAIEEVYAVFVSCGE